MRLSRILLPMVWPMVAVFAVGAAVGVAVPQPEPEVPAATIGSEGSDPSATDAPPPDDAQKGPKADSGTVAPDESPSVAISPEQPSSSPSLSEIGTCSDSEKVIVLSIEALDATPIDVGDAFDAAPFKALPASDDAAQLEVTVAREIQGKTDVVLLVSGAIDPELVNAIRRATAAKRLWVVVEADWRVPWGQESSVFIWDASKDEKLRSWATLHVPCLFTEES